MFRSISAIIGLVGVLGFAAIPKDNTELKLEDQVAVAAVSADELFSKIEKEMAVVDEMKLLFEQMKSTQATMENDITSIYEKLKTIESNSVSREDFESMVSKAVQTMKDEFAKELESHKAETSERLESVQGEIDEASSRVPYLVSKPDDCADCVRDLADHEKRIAALEAAIELLKSEKQTLSATQQTAGSYAAVSSVKSSGGGSYGSVTYAPVVSYGPVVSSGGGGSTGSYAVSATDTKRVRVVEPREPRRVTVMDVPEVDSSVSVQSYVPTSTCYTDENGNTVCDQGAAVSSPQTSSRPGFLGRVFGRRR